MTAAAGVTREIPFPGLRPFREDEEHLFFGRESQVDTIIDKLAKTRFLSVVGTSGSGKSSLVNCGLRPALHRGRMKGAGTRWHMAQFRPGSSPVRAMARALGTSGVLFSGPEAPAITIAEIVEATLRMSKVGLLDIYEQAEPEAAASLLVVVDQFEELFRYRRLGSGCESGNQRRMQEAIAFVNLLLEPRNRPELPIYVVLTMRSDFLGDCAEFPGLPEAINEGQYLVPRMTREERRAAIVGPVDVADCRINPVLLTRLVNDVGDNPDQLSILQHALHRTWTQWSSSGANRHEMSLPDYEAIGTMTHALDRHAEAIFDELGGDRRKRMCERIFRAVTDKGTDSRGVRRPTPLSRLSEVVGASEDEVIEIIEVFREPERSFLVPPSPEPLDAESVIDISHESLMRIWNRLAAWTDEEVTSAHLYRRIAETAALHAQERAGLLRDPELQIAVDWREREQPTLAWGERYYPGYHRTLNFLRQSEENRAAEVREADERRKRELEHEKTDARAAEQAKSTKRLRVFVTILTFMFLASTGLAVWAVSQRRIAERQIQVAQEQTAVAEEQRKVAEIARQAAQTSRDLLTTVSEQLVSKEGDKDKLEAVLSKHKAATLPPRIYLQITDEGDRRYANIMEQKLRDSGFLVLGTENLVKARPLRTTEVRYYKKAEQAEALHILDTLKAAGHTSAKLVYVAAQENNPMVRPNHFEIWFAVKNAL